MRYKRWFYRVIFEVYGGAQGVMTLIRAQPVRTITHYQQLTDDVAGALGVSAKRLIVHSVVFVRKSRSLGRYQEGA